MQGGGRRFEPDQLHQGRSGGGNGGAGFFVSSRAKFWDARFRRAPRGAREAWIPEIREFGSLTTELG